MVKTTLKGRFNFLDCSEIGGTKTYPRDHEGMTWKELIHLEISPKAPVSLSTVIENCCAKCEEFSLMCWYLSLEIKKMDFIVPCVITVDS